MIDNRKSVPDQYADALIEQNIMKQDERENILKQQSDRLTNEFRAVNSALPEWEFISKVLEKVICSCY